jgi:hypothetical protein
MTATFYKGDTVELFSNTGYNHLDGASTIEFIVLKPSGDAVAWKADRVDPADYTDEEYADLELTDEFIVYTTEPGDLDEVGTYELQSHIIWNMDSELHGTIGKFKVKEPLAEPTC